MSWPRTLLTRLDGRSCQAGKRRALEHWNTGTLERWKRAPNRQVEKRLSGLFRVRVAVRRSPVDHAKHERERERAINEINSKHRALLSSSLSSINSFVKLSGKLKLKLERDEM